MAQTEPVGGHPALGAKPSAPHLEEQRIYQRAFEACGRSRPSASMASSAPSQNSASATTRSKPSPSRLCPGTNSYIAATSDLGGGPVVLVVPPASDKGVLYG